MNLVSKYVSEYEPKGSEEKKPTKSPASPQPATAQTVSQPSGNSGGLDVNSLAMRMKQRGLMRDYKASGANLSYSSTIDLAKRMQARGLMKHIDLTPYEKTAKISARTGAVASFANTNNKREVGMALRPQAIIPAIESTPLDAVSKQGAEDLLNDAIKRPAEATFSGDAKKRSAEKETRTRHDITHTSYLYDQSSQGARQGAANIYLPYEKDYSAFAESFAPFMSGEAYPLLDDLHSASDALKGFEKRVRDMGYWLEENKSRLSHEDYQRVKAVFENARSHLDQAKGVLQWYNNGGTHEALAMMPKIEQDFIQGKASVDEISAKIETQQGQISEIDKQIADIDLEISSVQNLITRYQDMTSEGSIYYGTEQAEDAAILLEQAQAQLAELNKQRSELVSQRDSLQHTQNIDNDVYEAYWAYAFEMRDADEDYDGKVSGGQKIYDQEREAYEELEAHLTVKYRNNPAGADAAAVQARREHPVSLDIDHLSEEEKQTFYYLLGAGYTNMAVQYAQDMALAARKERLTEVEEWAGKNFVTMFLAAHAQGLLFPMAGVDFFVGARQAANTGLNASPDVSIATTPGAVKDALNSGVASRLNELSGTLPDTVPIIGGKGLGDAYQMGVSMGESYGSAAAFGHWAPAFMAMSATSSAYNAAISNGATQEQAMLEGIAQGVAEVLFENISIGKFLDGVDYGSIIKNALMQGGIEASEEMMTSIVNRITNTAIMRSKSDYEQSVAAYMSDGYSRFEAEKRANKDFWKSVAYDAFGGFATGSAMGGGQDIVKNAAAKGTAQEYMADKTSLDYFIATEAAGITPGDSDAIQAGKITAWLKDGAQSTDEQKAAAFTAYANSPAGQQATAAQQAQQQAEARAAQAQEANPDATVISSNGTQAYLDLGSNLAMAQKAGAVLDGIVKGEITADSMTKNQASALMLNTQIGVDAVSKVLGVKIEKRADSASNARALAKTAVRQYERNKAVATPVIEAQQTEQTMPETAEAQNVAAAQAQEMPQREQPVQRQTEQPTQQPVAARPRVIPRRRGLPSAVRMNTSYSTQDPQQPVESVQPVQQQDPQQPSMPFSEFEANYLKSNPGATFSQVAIAYGDYLNGRNGETRQSTKTGSVGLERNEYSDQLSKDIVDAVDSLGKLFGLRIRFEDLGTKDNGYYTIRTNEVVLDIAPSRDGINGKENAFRFVIAHEIGHAVKDRLGAERWQQFEDYAVKMMGGEKAITAKQQESEAYADKAEAKEDVACDFIGELLSDKPTLDSFCDAIRSGEVQKETARGFMAAVRKILGKLRGKGIKQFDAVTKQLAEKAAKQFGTELETAENAVKAMQQVLSEAAKAEKNTTQEDGVKKYAKKAKAATAKANNESESIKSQIRAAANILNEMDPVVSIYDPFDTGSNIDDAVKWAIPRIKTTSIERKGYATVLFDEHWIRNGLKYVAKNSNEVAAILAVPQVIKRGIEIGHDPNHKKRGFSTTTFGAPVELNGKRGNMGVVVKETKPYHYDVHRILTPDGYAFEIPQIENAEPTTEEAQSRNETAVVTPISSASNEIVSQDKADSQPPKVRKSLKNTNSNGTPLSEGQQQYFANSAVRDIGQYERMSLEQLEALPTHDKNGYDEAAAYRDSLLASSKKRLSKKISPETTAYSERYGTELQTEGQIERAKARDAERAKVQSDEASGKNAESLRVTDQKIAEALKMKPLRRRGLTSKAETEAQNKAADASLQKASVERAHKAIANEASRKMEQDTAKTPKQYLQMVEGAQKQAEKLKANYEAKINALKEQKSQLLEERRNLSNRNETLARQRKHEAKQAELERAFREDAEKENRRLVRAGVSLNNRAEKAEAATQAAKAKAKDRVQQQRVKTEHEAKQAELERAFRKDAEKENRRLDREIERMERQRDRMIRAIQVDALLQAEDNKQAIRAIANWRKKGLLPSNEVTDIDTEIRTLQEQAKLARGHVPKSAKGKARALGRAMQEVCKQLAFEFTSDVLPFEEIGRLQSRIDSAETAVTAFKNRSAMVNAVLTDSLRAPDGSVLDVRSAEEILGCWKNDKVGGKIDEGRQRLLDRYMYLLHNADRMSAVDNARSAMVAFLEKHPDYKVYAVETIRPDGSISSKDLSYKVIDIVEAAKNGDAVASEYITLAKAFADAKNKPVFGSEDGRGLDATASKIIAQQMEQKNPWLKQKAEEFYGWWDKFMQNWWVGIQGTQAQYDAMKKLYPHYVPTYRAIESGLLNWASSNRSIRSKNAVQAAKGSTLDLNTVGDNVARQIQNVINSALLDKLFENVYDAVLDGTEGISEYAVAGDIEARMALENLYDDNAADPDAEFGKKLVEKMVGQDKDYCWAGHYHGEERSLVVNRMVFSALKSITNQNKGLNAVSKVGNAVTKPMKTAITGVNLAFAARNIPRDFTTAMINSVAGLKYIAYYNMAIAKMFGDTGAGRMITSLMAKITNADISETNKEGIVKELAKSLENARLRGSKEWADFVALGGTSSTYARSETGFLWNKSAKGRLRNAKNTALEWLGSFNEATESMARFAEYLASIDMYGDTAEGRARAIKNAAEVTVDFSRHGRVGKVINAFAPYWNPGIQGLAKMYRSLRFPGEGKKVHGGEAVWEATKTLGKGAILFGVAPRLLQMAVLSLFGGEDEWEELSDRVKDTYFLIPKKDKDGNATGEFWKIPYNRDWGALFGGTFSRIIQGAKGREDNWRDYWDSVIAGNFSVKPNIIILTQMAELWRNKDFAGRSIVPYSIENGDVLREEAYTDDTSWFGKMLAKTPIGEALNLTPIEFDYLISSYLGDYGDMLIEATDADGINGLKGLFSDVIGNSFSADAAYSSLTMTRYYDMVDSLAEEVGTAKYKDPDTYKDTYGYEVQRAIDANYGELVTELNQQIKETEDEDEKRALKFRLQSVAQQALDFYERCMNGEIEDPVLYLTYEPYGDAIRDELTRLDEYNGEDYDYTFVPNPQAPKIGDHKNTDEEKAAYVDIYNRHYTEQVGSVMASLEYQNADDEQKLNYLEEARELAYYYSKQEFAQEFGIESETYDPDDATHVYDELMDAGFTFFEAYEVEQKYVTDLQRWTSIIDDANAKKLSDAEADAALRTYMDDEALAAYDACSKAGVTARQYVAVAQKISNLKPLNGAKGVTDAQKVAVCVQSTKSAKEQDALIRRYLDKDAEVKYDSIRKTGVTPGEYSAFLTARNTYADGAWSKNELRSWLRSKNFSDAEKAALWAAANSSWGRDDPNGWSK